MTVNQRDLAQVPAHLRHTVAYACEAQLPSESMRRLHRQFPELSYYSPEDLYFDAADNIYRTGEPAQFRRALTIYARARRRTLIGAMIDVRYHIKQLIKEIKRWLKN